MRIAYMLTSLGIGGAERQVVSLAERMANRGHAVVLVVLKARQSKDWLTSIEIIHLGFDKSLMSTCQGLGRAYRFLRGFRPDLVHSHTYPANMAARMLHALGSAPNVLSTIHNVYEGGWQRTILLGLSDGLSMHTIAVSQSVAERSISVGATVKSKCSVITNGIELTRFASNVDRRASMRAALHGGEDFIWLAAGRIVPAKDYPNLLRAFAEVRAAAPQTQLWIAGEGSSAEQERVQSYALALGISDDVHWLGMREDMAALFDACDGFALSSAWEGMPLVVGEAMAMEMPVVATDVGGVGELMGGTGMLVPAGDSNAFAGAMLATMRTPPETRRVKGHAAHLRIRQHFDMDSKAAEWEALYASLLNPRG